MGVEQIGQRARTEFDEENTSEQKPSTSGSNDVSNSGASTRRFGEGMPTCANSVMPCVMPYKKESVNMQEEVNRSLHLAALATQAQSAMPILLVQRKEQGPLMSQQIFHLQ